MRTKDDKKQEALFLATIKTVNEIGFAASSVAKIAKEAAVSPATLYVYFTNKDDLLISTYVEIKQSMSAAMLEGFDDSQPVHDILHRIWLNTFSYAVNHIEEFRYTEQFANSPYSEQIDKDMILDGFAPILSVVHRGIEQKIIKDVNIDIIGAFLFHPILVLANPGHCSLFEPTEENVETAFKMAWDALRL